MVPLVPVAAAAQDAVHWLCAVLPCADVGWLDGQAVQLLPLAKKFALHTNVATVCWHAALLLEHPSR